MFADTATIEIKAGKGGDGRLSFRHEKYRAMGGPDGGNGGKGGDVIFRVDHNSSTLSSYRTVRIIEADGGEAGGENQRAGKQGADIIVPMPQGTQVYLGEELIADLSTPEGQLVMAKGGRGGYGNAHFQSSKRQAPRISEQGESGEHFSFRLELKLVADVGLIGLPNSGKSTLLSVISNARPEIADYAFTTLIPNLGVVDHRAGAFLAADIPGLIEGASEGKGLGDEFLRHVERTAVLIHLIDAGSDDVARDYKIIMAELAGYKVDLSDRPQIVALSKIDTVPDEWLADAKAKLEAACGQSVFAMSAQAHLGLNELLDAASLAVATARANVVEPEDELPVIGLDSLTDTWSVTAEGEGIFRVTGSTIEGFAKRTNFDQDEGVGRLRDILKRQGIARELRRQGALDGDIIRIGETELAWLG
ncbi:GTPase ObgE [Candidatus Saccharibacteria bacterium]|nr:GTPase ObgE [Candidatus Saccharibacteria bacterium]